MSTLATDAFTKTERTEHIQRPRAFEKEKKAKKKTNHLIRVGHFWPHVPRRVDRLEPDILGWGTSQLLSLLVGDSHS